MKTLFKSIILFFLFFLMYLGVNSQQVINQPYSILYNRYNGEKLSSFDGGYTWVKIQNKEYLFMQFFLHKANGDVLKSYDGGYIWYKIYENSKSEDLISVNEKNNPDNKSTESQKVNISLYNLLGENVICEKNFIYNENQIFSYIKSSQIPNGMYLLRITGEHGITVRKISINN